MLLEMNLKGGTDDPFPAVYLSGRRRHHIIRGWRLGAVDDMVKILRAQIGTLYAVRVGGNGRIVYDILSWLVSLVSKLCVEATE